MTALIAEVSAASNEQSQGIEQINQAVNQMNQVIQSNAANAEEAAASSEELSAQAEELNRLVNVLSWHIGRSKGKKEECNRLLFYQGIEICRKQQQRRISPLYSR